MNNEDKEIETKENIIKSLQMSFRKKSSDKLEILKSIYSEERLCNLLDIIIKKEIEYHEEDLMYLRQQKYIEK